MLLFRDYIDTLSDEVCLQCIQDHQILARDGSIGDCALRDASRDYCETLGDTPTVLWMEMVATACYRRFAMRHIEEMK